MFKWIRIVILVFILLTVWTTMLSQKTISQNWEGTSDIVIIPINADDKLETENYIQSLKEKDFQAIPKYFDKQVKRYLKNHSHIMQVSLAEPIISLPPKTPKSNSGGLSIALWSLKLRWWMWGNKPDNFHRQQLRLYVLYSSPEKGVLLPHSTGLQKGLVGLIHARANRRSQKFNNLVIAHELLHIYGAKDKYDLATGHAIYPDGYAEPRFGKNTPQRYAALMGRTIPQTLGKHKVATALGQTIVNKTTAAEIGWIK